MFNHRNAYFFGSAANLWNIFIFAGVFSLTAPYLITLEVSQARTVIVGCVAIVIGIILKTNYFGIQIDLKNRQYRDFNAIFGVKRGTWHKLPQLSKMVLTSKNVSSWNTPNGISPTFKSNTTIYTIALFGKDEQPVLFFQTENESDANQKANHLSNEFKIQVNSSI